MKRYSHATFLAQAEAGRRLRAEANAAPDIEPIRDMHTVQCDANPWSDWCQRGKTRPGTQTTPAGLPTVCDACRADGCTPPRTRPHLRTWEELGDHAEDHRQDAAEALIDDEESNDD